MTKSIDDIQAWGESLDGSQPQEILAAAVGRHRPRIILACSFGAEDVVLVDMLHRVDPSIGLFYLDTDFLFPETYATRDRIIERYELKPAQVHQVKSLLTPQQQAERHGEALWINNPDQCCQLRKVDPLRRVLEGYDAWITGIRREQAPTRANAKPVEWDRTFELVKVNPLVRWTWADIWTYIKVYEVPYNPLHDQHYPSIGCMQCTKAVMPGDDLRSGRWQGRDKTECGLHKTS